MATHLLVVVLDDLEKFPEILQAWEEAGVPGATVLESLGSRRTLEAGRDDLPFMVSLRTALAGGEAHNRTLFSVIEEEHVLERAIQATLEIVGDFHKRHTGIMFVVPVSQAWGILKVEPHAH